ncbi:MAG: aspartate/glutamate racemase family protein [Gammaproteobacteria bacterium]|nr:aspartate/glutamate racemase family protein [Gammaproteobacteria bacterium]
MNTDQAPKLNEFQSLPVQADFELDDGPGRYRIGLIALSNDLATERDFSRMGRGEEIAVFVSRVPNAETCSVANLRAMEPELTHAASLLIPGSRLDAVAYSCTSGTVVLGYDTVAQRIRDARPGIPVTTPITASLAALYRLGAGNIAVLTPYTDEVNAPVAKYIKASGLDIAAFTSFQFASNDTMARTPPRAIYQAALEADRPEADALFISCTAIRAADVVDSIEQAVGKPVVTANQALFWQALRFAGCEWPIEGFGRLLRTASSRISVDCVPPIGKRML